MLRTFRGSEGQVEKRQYLFLGAGMVLALMAITLVGLQRRDQHATGQATMAPIQPPQPVPAEPLPAEAPPEDGDQADQPGEPDEPEADPAEAEEAAPEKEKLGPFLVSRADGELTVRGPDGDLLASADSEADARLAGKVGKLESLQLVDKRCDDPCNPHSQVFVSDGSRAWPVLDVPGAVRLQDLDRDGTVEALLDHLMEGTQELITLPYRLVGDRYVAAYKRFPDGVDRQITNLGGAVAGACEQGVGPDCEGTVRALVGLELFRGAGTKGLIGRLRLPPAASQYAQESFEEVAEELGSLSE
jgi:hypothetical protein